MSITIRSSTSTRFLRSDSCSSCCSKIFSIVLSLVYKSSINFMVFVIFIYDFLKIKIKKSELSSRQRALIVKHNPNYEINEIQIHISNTLVTIQKTMYKTGAFRCRCIKFHTHLCELLFNRPSKNHISKKTSKTLRSLRATRCSRHETVR